MFFAFTPPSWPISKHKPEQQVELFEKYALDLVSAAVLPFKNHEEIMEGGCECLSGMDVNAEVDALDLVLATMSIVKHYQNELEAIRDSWDDSEIVANNELMKNIRLILLVLQSSPDIFDYVPGRKSWRKYLFKKKRNPSGTASDFDRYAESAVKCYRSLLSMAFGDNNKFFGKLSAGARFTNALVRYDGTDSDNDPGIIGVRAMLEVLFEEISDCELSTPDADYKKGTVEDLRKELRDYWNRE